MTNGLGELTWQFFPSFLLKRPLLLCAVIVLITDPLFLVQAACSPLWSFFMAVVRRNCHPPWEAVLLAPLGCSDLDSLDL